MHLSGKNSVPPPSSRASLVAQSVKRPLAMWETQVRSLGREDPLEKEMATHSSILAWRILWTEEPDRLQSLGSQRVGHDSVTKPPPLFKGISLKHVEENLSPSCKNHEGNTQKDTDVLPILRTYEKHNLAF